MGVFTMEVEKINRNMKNYETYKKQVEREKAEAKAKKEAEKKQKELEKEFEKGLYIECNADLQQCFDEYISKNGIESAEIHFDLLRNREKTICKIVETIYNDFKSNQGTQNIKTINKTLIGEYLESNYNKILKITIEKYKADEQAKNKIITNIFKNELQKNPEALELAKKFGYEETAIYNENQIVELTQKLKQFTTELQEQQKEEKENKKWSIIAAIFPPLLYLLPFILVIVFLIWGYFYFAVPIIGH